MTEESLFEQALNTPVSEREALLDRECAGDPELRQRVEALLAAHAEPDDFLNPPQLTVPDGTGAYAGSRGQSASERPGAVIAGKYKLLQQIGEGGMGSIRKPKPRERKLPPQRKRKPSNVRRPSVPRRRRWPTIGPAPTTPSSS